MITMSNLKCDICGTDVTKIIEVKRSDGIVVKKQNIGIIIHTINGKLIVKCIDCYRKTSCKRKKKHSSYILLK